MIWLGPKFAAGSITFRKQNEKQSLGDPYMQLQQVYQNSMKIDISKFYDSGEEEFSSNSE